MSEPTKEELLFGRIALHNKLITEDQFKEALALRRRRTDVNHDFGRLLKARGFIDDKGYRSVRKAQEKALMGKGVSEEAARFLARGMTADGNLPPGEEAAPAPAPRRPTANLGPALAEAEAEDEVEEVEEVEEVAEARDVEEFEPEPEPEPAAPAPRHGGGQADERVAAEPRRLARRPSDPAAKKTMSSLLKKARESGASDLHLSCGAKPFLRLNGHINYLNMPEITPEQGEAWAAAYVSDEVWDQFTRTNDWDGSLDVPEGRFRANILRNRRGVSSVYRVIKTKIPTLAELGLPENLDRFTTFHQGLVLVTGATGSGKSSTLAALLDLVNQNRKDHIITMEDPIEYVFVGKGCNVTQRQIEVHTKSWGNALRASLREDPDVIMIGEMRDLDTVRLAITASETGHLVFGTLHTTSATRTIDRLLDVFPPGEQSQIRAMVSESLKGVISQRLLPTADGKGRVAAIEVLCWTPAVANLIREGATYKLHSVLQTGRKLGMTLMDESIKALLDAGKITKEVARSTATNPKLFQ